MHLPYPVAACLNLGVNQLIHGITQARSCSRGLHHMRSVSPHGLSKRWACPLPEDLDCGSSAPGREGTKMEMLGVEQCFVGRGDLGQAGRHRAGSPEDGVVPCRKRRGWL